MYIKFQNIEGAKHLLQTKGFKNKLHSSVESQMFLQNCISTNYTYKKNHDIVNSIRILSENDVEISNRILRFCDIKNNGLNLFKKGLFSNKNAEDNTSLQMLNYFCQIQKTGKIEDLKTLNELFRLCKDHNKKIDLSRLALINEIIQSDKIIKLSQINTLLKFCNNFTIKNQDFLKESASLLKCNNINTEQEITTFLSTAVGLNKITKNHYIIKENLSFAKQLLNNPKTDSSNTVKKLLGLCIDDNNKLNTSLKNTVLEILENDKINNSNQCLFIIENCKDLENNINTKFAKLALIMLKQDRVTKIKQITNQLTKMKSLTGEAFDQQLSNVINYRNIPSNNKEINIKKTTNIFYEDYEDTLKAPKGYIDNLLATNNNTKRLPTKQNPNNFRVMKLFNSISKN